MNMTIAETGKLIGIDVTSSPNAFDNEVLSAAFGNFPRFIPASVENIPVKSILSMGFLVSNEGMQHLEEDNDVSSEGILDSAEVMPQFPGGEIALQKYLCATIKYPVQAAEQGIQGKVHVSFVVFKDGSINNVKVMKGVDPMVDAEALRVIRLMPRWIPAKVNGRPVRVKFTVPINFVLQEVKY
jgi:TonB family protein